MAAFLLPLQGFWNVIVYTVTSRTACERLWARLIGQPQAPTPVGDRPESLEQNLISDGSRTGRGTGGSLNSIKSRTSRETRDRGREERELVDEFMMSKVKG